ncbi:nucleotidyltransferase domain-containing protein [Candidatus Woesearchaeota archaeon]|nr:nucleotidyltransferase domain-containing protein [Candidatus Woesearchaeota archaeon]MBT6336361.1 nucleotidyltransferase domain-containing protein [Candidatus Woesearchaeota archaeon]MBT7928263.1 nucleotidyltransferase domain-containing protein [Candidatus Woesearchaeota archaeon]
MEYFFINPAVKLRVRQIEREVKIPLPSAIRYAKELEKEGILRHEIIAGVKLYSADRSSKIYLFEKTYFNIKQLHSSGLIDYLIEYYSNPTIILFGSYSRGEDTEDSDIDIFVETVLKEKIDLSKFEKRLKKDIQLFVLKNLKEISNNHLANNILNGITLNGFIEVLNERNMLE